MTDIVVSRLVGTGPSRRVRVDKIVEYALGFCPAYPAHVDWNDLLYRIEEAFSIDLPEDMLDPQIKQIKKEINKARREAAQ